MLYGNFIINVDYCKIRNVGIEIYGDFCYELINSSLTAYNSWTQILKKFCKNNDMCVCKINCDHSTNLLIWRRAASRNKKLIKTCLHELLLKGCSSLVACERSPLSRTELNGYS